VRRAIGMPNGTEYCLRCLVVLAAVVVCCAGCGTTRVSDTQRTATEQLLVTHAVDQAISDLDFSILSGRTVYLDVHYIDQAPDRGYVISSLRQQLLAGGAKLTDDRNKAAIIVEARVGCLGTDRHDLLFGIPQFQVPTLWPGYTYISGPIPEIPFAKRSDKKGIAKLAVFAYWRESGEAIWQSGIVQGVSTARDTWLFGAGPFQRGTIRDGTEFAGQQIQIPLLDNRSSRSESEPAPIPVTKAAVFLQVRTVFEPPTQVVPATGAPACLPGDELRANSCLWDTGKAESAQSP